MNVRQLAAGAVGVVNAPVAVTIESNTGYTTAADGTQAPAYTTITTTGNVQALSGKDLEHTNNLNIQGVVSKIYLNGNYEGLFRVSGKGGDLIKYGGQTYLVGTVLERWPDWCCLALVLQTDGP